jgi:glycosyltransferase involved in cell wall biosynthesis
MDIIVVHSSAEVNLLAQTFNVSPTRFKFIPYFVRADAMSFQDKSAIATTVPYILAAGRNRDLRTFIAAIRETPFKGIIIGGEPDRTNYEGILPSNVVGHFEIPFQQYRAYIAGAVAFVVPLFASHAARSLGQIATFEAVARHVPVIAARTSQLTDYFVEDEEILFYEPENPDDLKSKIEQIIHCPHRRAYLTRNAYAHMLAEYTDLQYIRELLKLCVG